LVIHGTDDEVIDLAHGIAIHEKCRKPVEPLWVEGNTFSKPQAKSFLQIDTNEIFHSRCWS
jgi:hypothetical protein